MVKKDKEVETEKKLKIEEAKSKKDKKNVKKDKKEKKSKKVKTPNTITFKNEFNKIKWPTKKELVKYSIATIVFVLFFAAFFTLLQYLMALLKSTI